MLTDHDTYRIALFGHRHFGDFKALDKQLSPLLKELIRTKSYVEMYIGRNGEFDIYAASIMKQIQNMLGKDNNSIICVLPYPEKDIDYYAQYYDELIIPECVAKSHPKAAITKRNRWMVEQADLLICFVDHEKGGAYNTLKYGKRLEKKIINLAETKINT